MLDGQKAEFIGDIEIRVIANHDAGRVHVVTLAQLVADPASLRQTHLGQRKPSPDRCQKSQALHRVVMLKIEAAEHPFPMM